VHLCDLHASQQGLQFGGFHYLLRFSKKGPMMCVCLCMCNFADSIQFLFYYLVMFSEICVCNNCVAM
jgi:hypothetical protein